MTIRKLKGNILKISVIISILILPIMISGNFFYSKQTIKILPIYEKTLSLSGGEDYLDWGVDDIDAEKVWGGFDGAKDVNTNMDGNGVKVLVIDSGMDLDHQDLANNYKEGINIEDPDSSPEDSDGHGTQCAGIIGAIDNAFGVIGVAPKVDLYIAQMNTDLTNIEGQDQLIGAIQWGIQKEVDVISISLEYPDYYEDLENICNLATNTKGIVIVACSGNYYSSVNEGVQYPGKYGSTIAVGAINEGHYRWEEPAGFGLYMGSNYGEELDIVAPGVDIYTTTIDNGHTTQSGTSMACPMVAGVCSLLLSKDQTISPAQVKSILINTADSLSIPDYNENEYGAGIVDALEAINTLKTDFILPTIDIVSPSDGAEVSGKITIKASASDNEGIYKVKCRTATNPWQVMNYNSDSGFYECKWDTTRNNNGYKTITCRVFDYDGNSDSDTILVYVDNSPGCPILSVFDGEEYVEESLLDIHNPDGIDVITTHALITTPEPIYYRYFLRLTEHYKTISHIDQVKFYGRLPNGRLIPLFLISATHSSLGEVRWNLWFSDDKRVDVYGADHTGTESQYINLEFIAPLHRKFTEFIFIIEGNNRIPK